MATSLLRGLCDALKPITSTTQHRQFIPPSHLISKPLTMASPALPIRDRHEPYEVIDPEGDVLIRVSHGPKLLASSTVLRLASPVLARMLFSPSFGEGRVQRSRSNPQELFLPGDSHSAWNLLLIISHCRADDLRHVLPIAELLLDLAMLADKYQCVGVIQAECYRWLDEYDLGMMGLPALNVLAKATYFLEDHRHFRWVTAVILRDGTNRLVQDISSSTLRGE